MPPRSKNPALPSDDLTAIGRRRAYRISQRVCASSRQVKFSDFDAYGLRNICDYMGWSKLMELNEPVVPTAVQLFYANLEEIHDDDDSPGLRSQVMNQRIEITETALQRVFGFHEGGYVVPTTDQAAFHADYPAEQVVALMCPADHAPGLQPQRAHELTPRARLLYLMISHNLLPKQGHFDDISEYGYRVLYCALARVRIDTASLIIRYIMDSCADHRRGLPFAGLICRMLRDASIDFSHLPSLAHPRRIDRSSLTRMRLPLDPAHPGRQLPAARGKRPRTSGDSGEDDDDDIDDVAPADDDTGTSSSVGQTVSLDEYRRLEGTVRSLQETVQTQQDTMVSLQEIVQTLQGTMVSIQDQFSEHMRLHHPSD